MQELKDNIVLVKEKIISLQVKFVVKTERKKCSELVLTIRYSSFKI